MVLLALGWFFRTRDLPLVALVFTVSESQEKVTYK